MNVEKLTWTTAMVLLATLASPVQLAAQMQARYTVTDLGTLGGTFGVSQGINNRDWVVGFSTLPGDQNTHAFLWRNGALTDLGTLGGQNSNAAFPLNERGEIGGAAEASAPDPFGEDFCSFGTHLICLPYLWQRGVMTPLPTLGGTNGNAKETNNRGQVIGLAENATPDPTCIAPQILQYKPVVWDKSQIHELPTFPGDPAGVALAINDNGQGVGASGKCHQEVPEEDLHALLWRHGTMTDLGNLGGTMNNLPQDINNQSQVVGFSNLPGDAITHAFLWTEDEGMQDLGTLPGDFFSFAFGINGKSQVVGTSLDASGNPRAFLLQTGVMTDLNTLIPAGSSLFLLDAFSINSRGEIVGDALQLSTGEVHAYFATPIKGEGPSEDVASASPVETLRPKVVLRENIRKMLEQRLGHRYHIPDLRTTSAPSVSGTMSGMLAVNNDAPDSLQNPALSRTGTSTIMCSKRGQQCFAGHRCCPGLVCVPASTRAFCEP